MWPVGSELPKQEFSQHFLTFFDVVLQIAL
jgi:hypothetical protein